MKRLLTIAILIVVFYNANAQNTDYYDRMEHVFGNIDPTKVTTGFLEEFGIQFVYIGKYKGVIGTENLADPTRWRSIYSSLYSMRVGTAAQNMIPPSKVFDTLKKQQAANNKDILLAVQYYNYQRYKADAYTNGDVTVTNDRIYDVVGRNPYETNRVFAVTSLRQRLKGNAFSFKLPSAMIYTNTTQSLNQVDIDFGDGLGYQTIALDTEFVVNYTSGGYKELKYKFDYGSGNILYSHSQIWVDYIDPNPNPQARFDGDSLLFDAVSIFGDAWNGSAATGFVTIELAPERDSLTKPLIVIEGFDPENDFDYDDLINNTGPGGLFIGLGGGLSLNQAIEDEDYDLVFVNFENSTDFIQRNAYMVEEVIRWVNSIKVGNEPNVVLGMSMGGLVARYALRDMEINNEIHDTKLYISHDAPHQGANVPLAFQAMVRHLAGENISQPVFFSLFNIDVLPLEDVVDDFDEIMAGLQLLESPAARQMLIYQLQGTGENISIASNTFHDSFMTEYSGMGYPQQNDIKNIAISNGSECGTPLGFNPYATLIDIDQEVELPGFVQWVQLFFNAFANNPLNGLTTLFSTDGNVRARFNLKALPNQTSQRIYRGQIFLRKTVLFFIEIDEPLIDEKSLYSSSSMLPLDNSSGGIYNINTFASIPQDMQIFIREDQFNFIPTYSSLDISEGDEVIVYDDLLKAYTPLAPPAAPKDTPFDNFYTNPTTSEQHIQFTLNNGNWLMQELRDNDAFFTCASACTDILEIIGPSDVCTSGSYSIRNLTDFSDVVVNWSILPVASATLTTNGNSVTVVPDPSFSGLATLTATIATSCNDDVVVQTQIWLGKPSVIAQFEDGEYIAHGWPNTVCKYEQLTTDMTVVGETSVTWSLLYSSHTVSWNQIGDNLRFYLWHNNHTATFRFTATNDCGSVIRDYTFDAETCTGDNDPCSSSMKVAKNPVDNQITVRYIPAPCRTTAGTKEPDPMNSVATLYDSYQVPIRQMVPAYGTMNVDDLNTGHYILVVEDETNTKRFQIIIK